MVDADENDCIPNNRIRYNKGIDMHTAHASEVMSLRRSYAGIFQNPFDLLFRPLFEGLIPFGKLFIIIYKLFGEDYFRGHRSTLFCQQLLQML